MNVAMKPSSSGDRLLELISQIEDDFFHKLDHDEAPSMQEMSESYFQIMAECNLNRYENDLQQKIREMLQRKDTETGLSKKDAMTCKTAFQKAYYSYICMQPEQQSPEIVARGHDILSELEKITGKE
jgi:hypothetical protein